LFVADEIVGTIFLLTFTKLFANRLKYR